MGPHRDPMGGMAISYPIPLSASQIDALLLLPVTINKHVRKSETNYREGYFQPTSLQCL